MRSYARRLARRKSCLMAVWPGSPTEKTRVSWVAPLHPNAAKNFKTSPKNWPSSALVTDIGTSDFEFGITYVYASPYMSAVSSSPVFYNISVFQPFGVALRSTLAQVFALNFFTDKPNYNYVWTAVNFATDRTYDLKIQRIGTTGKVFVNGVLIHSFTGTTPTSLAVSGLWSNFDGTISAAYVKNITTGTTVWQAPWSDLYTTNNPWPSAVPRNFAVEPATWYDLGIQQQEIGDNDDASFFVDFEWNYDAAPGNIAWVCGGAATRIRFCVFANTNGSVTATSNLFGPISAYAIITLRAAGNPLSRGRHTVKCRVVGTTFYSQLDNEAEKSTTGTRLTGRVFDSPSSNADMSIYNAWMRNDTTGKIVWSYPGFAERVRLVQQMPNVAYRGVFEGVTTGVVRRVKTALDLRGNNTSKTLLCRCYIPSHAPDGKLYLNGLITQGNFIGSSAQLVFHFSISEDYRTGAAKRLYMQFSGASTFRGGYIDITSLNIFDRWVTLAATIDFATGKLTAYLDGVKIGDISATMEPFGQGAGSPFSDAVSILHDPAVGYISDHKIDWAQVHEGVLTEQEIAATNEYSCWTLPVGSGTLDIATVGIQNAKWFLSDGTTVDGSINQSVPAGSAIMRYTGFTTNSELRINAASISEGRIIRVADLPRVLRALSIYNISSFVGNTNELSPVKYQLSLYNLPGLTGTIANLPRISNNLYLSGLLNIAGTTEDLPRVSNLLYIINVPGLSGTTANLPRATNYLYLSSLPLLTGSASDLPINTGYRAVGHCPGITGALPVNSTNTPVRYHTNAKVKPEEYDQTIKNIVDAGGTNGQLYISSNKTAASDANIALLQSRGWTITVINDPIYTPDTYLTEPLAWTPEVTSDSLVMGAWTEEETDVVNYGARV